MTNANDAAASVLRRAIIRGDILPGERLKEGELAEELGISRTPIREAMLVLRAEGLIDLAPSRGATVRPFDLEELQIVYELRQLLEGFATRYAASRITDERLRELESSCSRMEALTLGDVGALNEENIVFHSIILDVVGSHRLRHIVKGLLEIPLPYKGGYWSNTTNKRRSERSHRRVVRAMRAHNADAAGTAMAEHLKESGELIMKALNETAPDPSPAPVAVVAAAR